MSARLRVGVPAALFDLPPATSVGRIWTRALSLLDARGDMSVVPVGERRRFRVTPRVDVWLTDGHQGPLDVPQPVVAHLHEASWDDPALRPLFEPAFLDHYEGPSAKAAAAAARIITVSESSRQQITSAYGVPAEHVVVAHNGLDHSIYNPRAAGGAELVTGRGGVAGLPYVLFVSVVHPRKNLAALREALAGLPGRGLPHALVLVAGPAADRADSADLLAEAESPITGLDAPVVNLAGSDDATVAALMAGAAAFCLPSLMEGFGMAVAEAMACGTPVVVSDRGALPEVVGEAGVVVAPEAAAVEAGLVAVLSDPARSERLRRAGIERARSFTWEAMAAGWARAIVEAA